MSAWIQDFAPATVAPPLGPPPDTGPLLACIDVGFGFLNPRWQCEGRSRIQALWNCAGAGQVWWAADLARGLDAGSEAAHYAALGFPAPGLGDHGSQVLDALAGPVPVQDAASRAPLALVALPAMASNQPIQPGPLGQSILRGLEFLLASSRGIVVVVIALGMCWGPRDGSSDFEQALDDLLEREPRLMVVWAGGSADRMAHAGLELNGLAGVPLGLGWRPAPAAARAQFLGLWLDDTAGLVWRCHRMGREPGPWQALGDSLHSPSGMTVLSRARKRRAELQLRAEAGSGAWQLELQAPAPWRAQAWQLDPSVPATLEGPQASAPRQALWNALAGSRHVGVAVPRGEDAWPGALQIDLPEQGLELCTALSGQFAPAGGSSVAAALAARALFNQAVRWPGPMQRESWLQLWRELLARPEGWSPAAVYSA